MLRSTASLGILTTVVILACSDSTGTGGGFDLTCNIPSNRFFSGGVDRDGIPALTNPEVASGAGTNFLADAERILGVVINGEARAYPFPVLWWHEMVNDTLGGANILVTYCPLTGSGIVFDPRVGGQARNFGVSGLLYENNLVMFDRDTESLWNQMLLGSQCGVERGADLQRIPVVRNDVGPLEGALSERYGCHVQHRARPRIWGLSVPGVRRTHQPTGHVSDFRFLAAPAAKGAQLRHFRW